MRCLMYAKVGFLNYIALPLWKQWSELVSSSSDIDAFQYAQIKANLVTWTSRIIPVAATAEQQPPGSMLGLQEIHFGTEADTVGAECGVVPADATPPPIPSRSPDPRRRRSSSLFYTSVCTIF